MTFRSRIAAVFGGALLALGLAGCSSISHKPSASAISDLNEVRHIAVFLDGTANDEGSDTNVKRLHSLVTLQDRHDIAALYVHGVGTDTDATGAATGSGINRRAQIAYEFILNNYRVKPAGQPKDKIYLFGFSRGAYTARILNSMLYHAGLPQIEDRAKCNMGSDKRAQVVHEAVAPVKAHYDMIIETQRRDRTQKELAEFNRDPIRLPAAHGCFATPSPSVEVEVLGLWDTVEALGIANWASRILSKVGISQHLENVGVHNIRYGDKLCNVQHAFHAVSIDDNRAWIFTPLLLTQPHHFDGCANGEAVMVKDRRILPDRLREVWFSGVHSDVGGGYGDSALSGVSLNWMIEQLVRVGAPLPPGARVRQDPFGTSHNPSTGFFNLTYHNIHRDLYRYAQAKPTDIRPNPVDVFNGRVCVHGSVFQRRQRLPLAPHENPQLQLQRPGPAHLRYEPIDPDLRWVWPIQPANDPTTVSLQIDEYPACANITTK